MRVIVCSLLCLAGALISSAHAVDEDQLAGRVEAQVNGRTVMLSAFQSDYDVEIRGDVVNVVLTQRFENTFDQPLNATYLFPLNRRAAVHAVTLRVGEEVIVAEIQEKQQAQKTFQAAKSAGKSAALLKQHRPNMFTQAIANLMPGMPMTIEIAYSQVLSKVDGDYELVIPMVVGPRFQPAGAGAARSEIDTAERDSNSDRAASTAQWQLQSLPAYPLVAGVSVPETVVAERVSLSVNLEAPLAIDFVASDTHPLKVDYVSATQRQIGFAAGKALDNRDFTLRYGFAGDTVDAGLLTHWQTDALGDGYFSLVIEPPQSVASDAILAREMVFLLDCSGSMAGAPIHASKLFMRQALQSLRPQDSFRIIRFSDTATEFSRQPLPATAANIQAGLDYTDSLYGGGGTVMTSGIQQALTAPVSPGAVRNVVFLTDGYIGNEMQVLQLVTSLLDDARLFAFGVGSGVNRYLMSELGRVGRGFTRYFDPTRKEEDMQSVVSDLVDRLRSPVLTDVGVDWGDLPVTDLNPAKLPDLYAGQTLRVSGRYSAPGSGEITISGRTPNSQAKLVKAVQLDDQAERPVVRRLWAREAVAGLMHNFTTPKPLRAPEQTDDALKQAITRLGLDYGLTTRWTAFVAVSQRRYNPNPSASKNAQVPLPKVAGVSALAYAPASPAGFAAPEPGTWLGLFVGLASAVWLLRRRRRQAPMYWSSSS